VVSLTATADLHWIFENWTGDLTGSNNPDSLTITDNMTVTANYTQTEFGLEIFLVGMGVVDKEPDQDYFNKGGVVTLTATADPGWTFAGWSGDINGSNNPLTITMDVDTSITATFTQNEYNLIVTSEHGSVTLNPSKATYHYGDQVTLTAAADSGWSFIRWISDLNSTDNPVEVTILGNMDIIAIFEKINIFLPFVTK